MRWLNVFPEKNFTIWSEPLNTLCSRFGISDVALKKTCARSEIPTPERGYWAKKDAGKPTVQVALPIRPPGMDDQVLIAAGQYYQQNNSQLLFSEW